MEVHADTWPRAKPSKIEISDLMLVFQRNHNKLTTAFYPSPFHVTSKKGTMIIACQNAKCVTYNTSQLLNIKTLVVKKFGKIVFLKHWGKYFGESRACLHFNNVTP